MKTAHFDVIIVGAGPAGVTAAGALAGTGISVALIEAGVYAGAENWSGCVYFADSLASPECFGPAAVQEAPYERQVVRRGILVHNGLDEVGVALTDAAAFKNCYTVLRPVYDPYFAHLAQVKGAVLLTETTVTSLIRKNGRVAGVQTNQGPLSAGVVFIAEGDASHLVRAEGLERRPNPHYLQGVKAVMSLPTSEIEKRFQLDQGEGAAFEILIRNPSIAGRTAKLNMGGFLYTNRDSLSLGYVLPLDNLKKNYRGDHSVLLEWMKTLPGISSLTENAKLSAYGTKIIRRGGWRDRPVLVENGLAVGGASMGLGVDIPFPNFTGPASATGLFFARAVKGLMKSGKSLDAKNLTKAYLNPLTDSVYSKNAQYLSRWPDYFGRSRVLFGRTADVACGTTRFLASNSLVETGRFLRNHIVSLRGIRELVSDTRTAVGSLRLWKPIAKNVLHPATIARWFTNLVTSPPAPDPRLEIILNINGKRIDPASLPWPVSGMVRRLSPAIAKSLGLVYANDDQPAEEKFSRAVSIMARSFRLSDFVILPLYGLTLFGIALGTALYDAFRYFVLKTPADKMLAEPVMAYGEALKKARDLDAVKPPVTLEAKLAANSYRVGAVSHIRTLWPAKIPKQSDMAQAALWWVCPARVYQYDAPLMGRGNVVVHWENCIKCESCWRAEPSVALWGRFTDHNLIYRPESAAIADLIASLRSTSPRPGMKPLTVIEERLWYVGPQILRPMQSVLHAAAALKDAVSTLPASADTSRRLWPAVLGARLLERLAQLETALANDGRPDPAAMIKTERAALDVRIKEGRLFHALYAVERLERILHAWLPDNGVLRSSSPVQEEQRIDPGVLYAEASKLFPDRIVKQWEEEPLPEDWADQLRQFIAEHQHPSRPAIRALSSVSPALGLIAAHQARAMHLLKQAGREPVSGICAVDADGLAVSVSNDGARLTGTLHLVPTTAATSLLVLVNDKGYLIPLDSPGVKITRTPAIGFRAAGLATIALDSKVKQQEQIAVADRGEAVHFSYLTIALGAGDYLSRRAMEHAAGRVQFPGQMLDTEGRDGIAKLGAVKAMIARTEAWRLLLETLYRSSASLSHHSHLTPQASRDFGLLCSTIAAVAFGPENGCMAYDAGQVFGGFAYSEDDLLSRFYRDSALFRFLSPGNEAPRQLWKVLADRDLEQACDAELGGLGGISGMPLAPLARRWRGIAARFRPFVPRDRETDRASASSADIADTADPALIGEAAAVIIGIRGLLSRIEQGLDAGRSMEAEAAAAEVLLGLAEDSILKARIAAGSAPAATFPIAPDLPAKKLDVDYESFCAAPGRPHRSGTFLITVFDRSQRYVPEMQLHDPKLRARWIELADWFRQNCSDRSYEGMHFERYVEKLHAIPADIIKAVKDRRWLATYVPRSEDGLGWHKAEYYILNSAAGSFGDASVCLLIMASTSIGTTPMLLGIDDELPRVREELEPLVRDKTRINEIGARIKRLIATFKNPNPAWIRKEYQAVLRLVDTRIRYSRVVKYLAANFLRSFYGAGIAGRRGDFGGFTAGLQKAAALFDRLLPDIDAALAELPRRERCHKLYLRTLGHGAISAFALTEPTAGSDTGGVKTMAHRAMAALSALPDGRYRFSLNGEGEKHLRYLIDADRIVFLEQGMAYRAPDDTPALIKFDRYDHAADEGVRYYEYQGAVCEFHDIGQVRNTGSGPVYEYYNLTGAKMWITNGSLATQFCLYAQSPEGVTGFIVDRYAEGSKVGADEHKTGQRGSPTNEISLDNARVAREAVIGYEGHGQVNALETLNVGRCGLAAVAGAIARKLIAEARQQIPAAPERDRLLGEAAAVIFGSESLAYYLIGLFDRPHESVRMESAIAKFVCSEDLHDIISILERAHGPEGQTEQRLIEKARRDARILNIYEGTNEVQRFLILKDLISQAANWPELPNKLHERPDDDAAAGLAHWKSRLRLYATSVAAKLGDVAWTDAMLQPALFPLADMAGEILRLECLLYRMEWLGARRDTLGQEYVEPLLQAGNRARLRTLARLGRLEEKCRTAWKEIDRDLVAAEVRAADAALNRAAAPAAAPRIRPLGATKPLRVLCCLRPVADISPLPRLTQGALAEVVWTADPLDRAGLDQAFALKAAGGTAVTVDVLLPGEPEQERILRISAPAADALFRIDGGANSAATVADAIRDIERSQGAYDMIVLGTPALDGGPDLAPYLAGTLQRLFLPLRRLGDGGDGSGWDKSALPAIVGISESAPRVDSPVTEIISSLLREVTVIKTAAGAPGALPRFSRPAGAAEQAASIATPAEAAAFLKAYAAAATSARAEAYDGKVGSGTLPGKGAIWALLDPGKAKANLAALSGCATAAALFGKTACCLVAAPREHWPALLGLARQSGMEQAFCLDTGGKALSESGRRKILALMGGAGELPMIFGGPGWNHAFGFIAGERSKDKHVPMAMNIVAVGKNSDGSLILSSPAYDGALVRQEPVGDGSALVTMSEEADLPAGNIHPRFAPLAIELALRPEWTVPLPPPAEPTLAQAEVIIDLGYGIKDTAGMDLAQELKNKLMEMGLAPLFGATRKVTQDLKLLPLEAQIGQTGVRVNPKVIIALGISGAPQHVDWIGARAQIISFNKDAEAPLMKLNQTRPGPKVHPIVGDLFVTVREMLEKLR